jgi:hypothetical protein
MRLRLVLLLVASVVAWLFGAAASATATPGTIPMFFPAGTSLLLVVVSVFAFSFLLFGYLAPLAMFFAGMHTGLLAKAAVGFSSYVAVAVVCAFLAAYAAIRLGQALLEDITNRGSFKGALKVSLLLLVVAFAAPAVADYYLQAPIVVNNCFSDEACFQKSLAACEPAQVTTSDQGATFYKEVRGQAAAGCLLHVSAANAKSPDMQGAEGKEMDCTLAAGATGFSGSPYGWDIGSCTGGLADYLKTIIGGN